MRCYNCGCELSEHTFCTNCGVDVALYKKIIRTSNFLYNQGLERAKVRDLSGAIVSLRQSLKFNKSNIKARNLLGLIYFEMGEVPAALSEWVISKNIKPKKNMAADYLELLQTNSSNLDTINDSIKKYNKALEYCQGEDGVDLAIIQLKAALRDNPKFVRALQLLALCFIKVKKPEAARRQLDKCKAIDVNNITTLRYYAEVERLLNPVDEPKVKKSDAGTHSISYMDDNQLIIQPIGPKEKKGPNTVLNIVFGIGIGFALTMMLVVPGRINKERMAAQESTKSYCNQLDAKNITINEMEQKISDQNEKITNLTETLSAYAGTEGTLQSMENLLKAAGLYLQNPESFLEVADYLREVDETTWTKETSENYKMLYKELKATVAPKVSAAYYNEGMSAYKSKQYADAIAYFEGALFFDAAHKDSLYYLAVSYQALDKTDEAKLNYNKVIELFPGTWHSQKSEKALKDMAQ